MGSPAPLGESEPNNPAAQDLDELFEDSELSSPDEERLKKKLEEDEDAKGDEDNPDEEVNQTPEMKRKAFLQAWKGMRGEKSEAEDGGFKPGVEIYFSHTDSSLPPYGVSGKEWKKFKVTDVDWGK